MRPHAWLINTARGAVVDEVALYDALVGSASAAPPSTSSTASRISPWIPAQDLRTLSNVILTPHVGSTTPEANRGMADTRGPEHRLGGGEGLCRMDLLNPEVSGKN